MSWLSKTWKSTKKHAKKAVHSAGRHISDAATDVVGLHKDLYDMAEDGIKGTLALTDPFSGTLDLFRADNPWEQAWENVGGLVETAGLQPFIDSAAEQGWIKDDHARYYNDSNKLGAGVAAAVVGTVYGGPVGYGAAMGAMSGMGISIFGQGENIDWGKVGMAGVQGGVTGAAGGYVGGQIAPFLGGVNEVGTGIVANARSGIYGASVYGGSGFGAAYGETGDLEFAAKFGGMAALGGGLGIASGLGAMGGGLAALSSGLGAAAMQQQDGGGDAFSGGNYAGPSGESADPNAGSTGQSKATKSVPEAEFLDGGGGNWGNAGIGGVFGGLDKLSSGDKFVDTNKMKQLFAQRKAGAFVK